MRLLEWKWNIFTIDDGDGLDKSRGGKDDTFMKSFKFEAVENGDDNQFVWEW